MKWNNPEKGVAPSPTPRCSSYGKGILGSLWSPTLLTYLIIYIYIYIYVYVYNYFFAFVCGCLCIWVYSNISLNFFSLVFSWCIYIYIYICVCVCVCVYVCVCVCVCDTIIDVYTAELLPTKPSSDDDWVQAWFRGRSIITTNPECPSTYLRYHQTLLNWHHSLRLPYPRWYNQSLRLDLFFIFINFLLSDGESPRLIKNAVGEFVMIPWHLTSIGIMLVIQTHCSRRPLYFSPKNILNQATLLTYIQCQCL